MNSKVRPFLLNRFATLCACLWVLNTNAPAQTSTYNTMTLAGNFTGWNPGANNLTLVSNNLWQGDFYLSASGPNITNEFKFAANGNWSINWGHNTPTHKYDAFSGTAGINQANIRHSHVIEGLHRFRFNSATREYSVQRVEFQENTNLLRNASFELQGQYDSTAAHWELGYPDNRGSSWGNAFRANWRSQEGNYMAAIGALPDARFGGWWQETPIGPGYLAEFNGYAYQDPVYTATVKQVKIEYYNNQYDLIQVDTREILDLEPRWKPFSLSSEAPAQAGIARLVIDVNNSGEEGTIEFDNFSLIAKSQPSQSFNEWTNSQYRGKHAKGGWLISTGYVTDVNAYSTMAAGLVNPTANNDGGYIRSGYLQDGLGVLSFKYRHAWVDPSIANPDIDPVPPDAPVQIYIQRATSINGPWSLIDTIVNISNDFYETYTKLFEGASANPGYVRIIHAGLSTNDVLIDDIAFAPPSPTLTYLDFESSSWTNSVAFGSGCYEFNGWTLCTGEVVQTTINPLNHAGYLNPSSAAYSNTLVSPIFEYGIGRVTFRYARGTNNSDRAKFAVQKSPDGTNNWQTIDVVENVLSTGFSTYERTFNFDTPHAIRVINQTIQSTGPAENIPIIVEGFDDGNTAPEGWNFNSIGTYTSTGNFGEKSPSLKFDRTGDRVTTPMIVGATATGMTFWTKGQGITSSSLIISGLVNSAWQTIRAFSGVVEIPNSPTIQSVTLPSNTTQIVFHYVKNGGNLSFDDVKIFGRSSGSSNAPQGLLIDNISVSTPVEYRSQNFNAWPTQRSYGLYEFQGWRAMKRAIIDNQNAFEGQVARLDNSTGLQPYLESPALAGGIGSVSFKYRHWRTSEGATLTALIQLSNDGLSWTTKDTITFTGTEEYLDYNRLFNDEAAVAIRIVLSSGSDRMLIDNVVISRPQPPARVTLNAEIVPRSPFTNDPVNVSVNYSPSFGATDIEITTHYRIGTNGAFTAIPMTTSNFLQLTTASPIPPQPTNTIVQYYVSATFKGPGSDTNSPVYYPPGGSNNPAFYGIPRTAPGSVWINEVRYNDFFDFWGSGNMKLIELVGQAGVSMQGWKLETIRLSTNETTGIIRTGVYPITNSVVFSDQVNGFGFWLIADSNTPNRSQTLTNKMFETPLGIQLLNEANGVESAISFGGDFKSFERINVTDDDPFFGTSSISLIGTGTNYSSFTWTFTNTTSGTVNENQILGVVPPSMSPPEIFHMAVNNSVVYVWTYGNTNNWSATPYFTTNLNQPTESWLPVPGVNRDPITGSNNGTNLFWFTYPASNTASFYIKYNP